MNQSNIFANDPDAFLAYDEESHEYPISDCNIDGGLPLATLNFVCQSQEDQLEQFDDPMQSESQSEDVRSENVPWQSESEDTSSSCMNSTFGHLSLTQQTDESEPSTPASPRRAPHRRGRKVRPETKLLAKFKNTRKPFSKPKKEYLRVKTIRGFKRSIRQTSEMKLPNPAKIHGFDSSDAAAVAKWSIFQEYILSHPTLFDIAPTYKGPETDGRAYRDLSEEAGYRCFNNHFCKDFFKVREAREAFLMYLEVVFHDEEEEVLAKKFEFTTVAGTKEERQLAWKELKEYLRVGVFHELGLS